MTKGKSLPGYMYQQHQLLMIRWRSPIAKAHGSTSVQRSWSSPLALNGSNLDATQKQLSHYQLLDDAAVWFVH
jgi:hypothetical protein